MTQYCPVCGEPGVPASGPEDADILIIGEFPGEDEMQKGRPFVGPTGKVLRNELRIAGIEFNLCRVANIWLHEPTKDKKGETQAKECRQYGLDLVLDEAKNRKAILLVGSECAETFTGMSVMKICGLQVESPMLSCDTIFAVVNPAIVFQPNKGVGEVRLALKKFAAACKQKGLIDEED